MTRDKSISVAADSRARVPFAVIAVVLLTTSIVTVSTINNRSTPERDVGPDELNRRLTVASQSIISSAVDDAIAKAGVKPVTKANTNKPIGKALVETGEATGATEDSVGIKNYDDNENGVFSNYVKLLIYKKINRRLDQATQWKDGAESDVKASASLPPLQPDKENIENALDRITVTVGPTDELAGRGEVRVEVSGVRHRVFTRGTGPTSMVRSDNFQEVYKSEKEYTVTEKTAVFEMHSQTEDYEDMLDNDMEGGLYARQWPFFVFRVVVEWFTGKAYPVPIIGGVTEPGFFNKMITLNDQEVFLNSVNYNFQQAAFGTTDQSYPEMMDAGWACFGQLLGGEILSAGVSFAAGELAGGTVKKNIASFLASDALPTETICTLMMYDAFPQATTTADAGMPSTFAFTPESDWQPPRNYAKIDQIDPFDNYDPVAAAEAVEEVSVDPSNAPEGSGMTGAELEQRYNEHDLMREREIKVDSFANATYKKLFEKGDVFSDTNSDETGPSDDAPELPDRETGNHPIEMDTDTTPAEDRVDEDRELSQEVVSNERERVVNELRMRLIEDIDSYTVSRMQYMTSENVYGKLIRQIELRSERYVYSDIPEDTSLSELRVYELRNQYIRKVVDMIEKMEKARQEGTSKIEGKMDQFGGTDDTTLNEELVRGQLALENENGNVDADRAEELSEHANHATDGGKPNRWSSDDTERGVYARGSDSLYSRKDNVEVNTDGLPVGNVDRSMLFRFGMESAPGNLETIKKTTVAHTTSGEGASTVPFEMYKDYPPEPFPDDFKWPDGYFSRSDKTLTDDELPPPEEFDENALDDVANREEYDFPRDAEFPDDLPEDAREWYIRPVEPEKNIYRIVNAQDPSRTLAGSGSASVSSGNTVRIGVEARTYIQIRDPESEEFDATLTPRAEDIVEDDSTNVYTITAVDVPQVSGDPENPIGDAKDLLPPKLQDPPPKNLRFDIHASPGYLSAQPISRQAEPGIRTASGGITHARNSAFTSAAYQVSNAVPNPGLPIVLPPGGRSYQPFPINLFPPHVVSMNYWNTEVKAEYARFELRAKPPEDESHDDAARYTYADGLNGGPEKYVRLAQDVTVEVGDTNAPAPVGRVEPIDVAAQNHYPFAMPGYVVNPDSNWGLGDYLIGGGYGPGHCTPSYPYVGPDVPTGHLITGLGCADLLGPGPIGNILRLGSPPGSKLDSSGKLIFAVAEGGKSDFPPVSEKYQAQAEKVCTRDRDELIPQPIYPRQTLEETADCPDILYRDRFD